MAEDEQPVAADEALFDVTLKKKKKKKVVAFSEDPLGVDGGADAPVLDEPAVEEAPKDALGNEISDFSDIKKKKKKKATFDISELEGNGDAPASTEDLSSSMAATSLDDFSDLKKKKKSKKSAVDLEAFERELQEASKPSGGDEDGEEDGEENAAEYDEADLGDDVFASGGGGGGDDGPSAVVETWHGTDRDYTYAELLGRIMQTLHAQNPDLSSGRKRYTIVPPSVHRDGNKKTVFANVVDICKRMRRQPEHVISFLFAELGTTGSVDGEKRLVIKGRFQPKQLENVLRRYIVEYVTCKTCKSPETTLSKENRLYFMTCESCGSKRSVSAIKTGFVARTGKRKKAVA